MYYLKVRNRTHRVSSLFQLRISLHVNRILRLFTNLTFLHKINIEGFLKVSEKIKIVGISLTTDQILIRLC